jgi:hypothetical protein
MVLRILIKGKEDMKNLLTVVLLGLSALNGSAKDIMLHGTVLDDEVKIPLIGAVVRAEMGSRKDGLFETVTDFQGRFSLELPQGHVYSVHISFPGYTSLNKVVTGDDFVSPITVTLAEQLTVSDGNGKKKKKSGSRRTWQDQQANSLLPQSAVGGSPVAKSVEAEGLAEVVTRKMKNKLQLTPTQTVVVELTNQKYFSRVIELQSNPGDSTTNAKLHQLKKARTQRLEEILTESQFDKWMRYVQKEQF